MQVGTKYVKGNSLVFELADLRSKIKEIEKINFAIYALFLT